jgi:teichoic acid transport system ATP-binding protein
MRARLGFSIATSVEPDVLLLDEVLGTGDQSFRDKSRQRVMELVRAAKGIVLVTHDMNWVTEFCNRALLLEHGQIVIEGDPAEVVRTHQEHSAKVRIDREAALRTAGVR